MQIQRAAAAARQRAQSKARDKGRGSVSERSPRVSEDDLQEERAPEDESSHQTPDQRMGRLEALINDTPPEGRRPDPTVFVTKDDRYQATLAQVGCLALLATLSYPKKLAGGVVLSGWLALRDQLKQKHTGAAAGGEGSESGAGAGACEKP